MKKLLFILCGIFTITTFALNAEKPLKKKSKEVALLKAAQGLIFTYIGAKASFVSLQVSIMTDGNEHVSHNKFPKTIGFCISGIALAAYGCKITKDALKELEEIASTSL